VGWEKVACCCTKAAMSLKRVKIEEKLLWRSYKNLPMLFLRVTSLPTTASSSPRMGVRNPHSELQSLLSHEWVKLWTSSLGGTFIGSIRTKAHEKFREK